MPLTLSYKFETSIPVEIEGFTPTWAKDKTISEIEKFEIFHGNERLKLGDVFDIEGNASDLRFDFQGNLSGVHWVGAQMSEGKIHVHGPCGRHIGQRNDWRRDSSTR